MALTREQVELLKEWRKWDHFVALREAKKLQGIEPSEAAQLAYSEVVHGSNDTSTSTGAGLMVNCAVSELLSKVPPMPANIANRTASEVDSIRWVCNHIMPGTDLADCPSPAAWLDVFLCRMDAGCMVSYLEKMRGRLVPNRGSIDDEEGKGPIDGTPTLEFLAKLASIGEEAQGERGDKSETAASDSPRASHEEEVEDAQDD